MAQIQTKPMTVKAFAKIMDNPLQRDTKAHATKALKKHMSEYHPSHAKVAIAKAGGVFYKLDGHTRSYLWGLNKLEAPGELSCDIYTVASKEEAIELYKHFDSSKAVETKADQVSGALKFMGIKNASVASRSFGIANAIATINAAMAQPRPGLDVDELLKPFKKELKILINMGFDHNPSGKRPGTPSCVTAAFLILSRLYGEDCLGFWENFYYGHDSGLKAGRDGAKAAADYIIKQRREHMLMGRQFAPTHIEALINGYLKYNAKKPVSNLKQLYSRNAKLSANQQLKILLTDLGFKL